MEGNGERAYFYKAKNYIIEKPNDKYEIHGSSLKGSKHSKVVDRAIKLGIDYIFNNKPIDEVIREAYNLSNTKVEDYIERTKLSKEKIEYDDVYNYRFFLAKQIEDATGQIISKNDQIGYIITKNQLPGLEYRSFYRNKIYYTYANLVKSTEEINKDYYIDLIDKALMKFGVDKTSYISTNLFGQNFEKKPVGKNLKLATPFEGEI